VHSCWCIVLFVLDLNSNLFEFKWNGLNGWSIEKEKKRRRNKRRQSNPLSARPTSFPSSFLFPSSLPHGPRRPTCFSNRAPAQFPLSPSRAPLLSHWSPDPTCRRLPFLLPPSTRSPLLCFLPRRPRLCTLGPLICAAPEPAPRPATEPPSSLEPSHPSRYRAGPLSRSVSSARHGFRRAFLGRRGHARPASARPLIGFPTHTPGP
jgi:hypothetical protein